MNRIQDSVFHIGVQQHCFFYVFVFNAVFILPRQPGAGRAGTVRVFGPASCHLRLISCLKVVETGEEPMSKARMQDMGICGFSVS